VLVLLLLPLLLLKLWAAGRQPWGLTPRPTPSLHLLLLLLRLLP
jgi:hypothetical protein